LLVINHGIQTGAANSISSFKKKKPKKKKQNQKTKKKRNQKIQI